jgi:hypothetical protein
LTKKNITFPGKYSKVYLIVSVTVNVRVVSKVEGLDNSHNSISPDGFCDERVVTVRLYLPHHLLAGQGMIATMKKSCLRASVKVFIFSVTVPYLEKYMYCVETCIEECMYCVEKKKQSKNNYHTCMCSC